jgi:twitching motility protein PilT
MDELLQTALQMGVSDLHITAGLPPMVRRDGVLMPMEGQARITVSDAALLLEQLLTESQLDEYARNGAVDFSRSLPGQGRFRVNAYRQRGAVAIALRLIPIGIPQLSDLGLPPVVAELARKKSGLILVTGPTSSGKSTTQAAMIRQMSEEDALHILTLEDPIEFLHRHGTSMINQREIGPDVPSFAAGLRSALREDPDVILVGEMSDLDTTQISISAAETGHLVLATLRTPSAAQTIDRIIDIFPPYQQAQIRIQLASSLQGVIAQQLLPRSDKPGRVAAVEVLVANSAVRSLIREGKTHQLQSIIQTSAKVGMVAMEASLKTLWQDKVISEETYHAYSSQYAGTR